MTRAELENLILETYNVKADYPFNEDFETAAFRHKSGKWFALAMSISENRLGHESHKSIEVVNLKCAPEVIESLVGVEPGIYPAYHMNKAHWITVALSKCDEETISWLLGISFDLTNTRIKKR